MSRATAARALSELGSAHHALLRQQDLQFRFTQPKSSPPEWWVQLLEKISGPVLKVLGPVLPYIFWAAAAVAVIGVLAYLVRELIHRPDRTVRWKAALGAEPAQWRPEPEKARALLAEADELAARGLYAEAAHLVLLRGIEEIRAHRPNAVRPALTSRDIAALPGLPEAARQIFVSLAEAVERSLFGGRDLDRAAFTRCRDAYEAFAAPGSWA